MHICSVITSFTTGGAEILVAKLSRHFVEAGHEVSILALSDAAAVGNSRHSEREMIESLRSQDIFAMSLGLDGRRSMLKGRKALMHYLNARPADVLHVHTGRAALMAGFARTQAPLIFTHHNSRLSFPRHLYKLFDRFVYSYVGISSTCASQTRRFARRPVRLIMNGTEVPAMAEEPRTMPSAIPTIIAVGTISNQKDYPTLINAAKCLVPLLESKGQSFNLNIVGGGEQMAQLLALVKARRLEQYVHLLGVRHDVPDLLHSSDLFVNSSKYEGLSLAVSEALMCALPVVATDVHGNSEQVQDGENGLLVPQSNPEALARAMAKVLTTPDLYRRLSEGALRSSSAYTLKRCASEHLELYQEALAFASARRRAA